MFINADSVTVDSDEGEFTLEISPREIMNYADVDRITIGIHLIDLDAFYNQVKARIGPYLQERDEALWTMPRVLPDEASAYDVSDPKHENFHSVHADLYDQREGK